MSEWKEYRLGEIADIQNGYAFKSAEFSETGVPIIKIKNIVPPTISLSDTQFYSKEISAKLKKFIVYKNDFLISMTGSTVNQMASAVGKMGRYPFESPSLINQRVGKIYSTSSKISNDYLYYFLNRYEVQYDLALSASGSANQANISPEQLKSYKISVPDIDTQTAIAEILSSLDDKIELNDKINQELEALARVLFKQWFVDFEFPNKNCEPYKSSGGKMVESELGEIPKGWEVARLSELISITGGGTPKRSIKEYWDGDIKWFSVQDVPSSPQVFVIDTKEKISDIGLAKSSTKLLRKGTTIITARGTVGKLALVAEPMAMNQSCYGIVGIRGTGDLFTYFNLKQAVKNLKQNTHGAVFDTITTNTFASVDSILPMTDILNEFEALVSPCMAIIESHSRETQQLSNLRDTLLPRLISGELQVSEVLNLVAETA